MVRALVLFNNENVNLFNESRCIMKVVNMISSQGNRVANQFIITQPTRYTNNEGQEKEGSFEYFQSYDSIIVRVEHKGWTQKVYLDRNKWDYSKTTGKYRNQFLGENKAETQKKIDSGEYTLTDLN